jgi:hypothetical protein
MQYPQLSEDIVNNTPNLERQKLNPRDSSKAPWNRSIVIILEVISSLTNISNDNISVIASNIHSAINPKTGTPEGLAKFVDIYEKIEYKIRRLLSDRGVGETEFDVSVKSSVHKERFKKSTIKVKKRFNQVFNSDTEKNIEYDFLGGRKTNRGGLREISPDFFRNRIDNENSKYFAGELRADASPVFDLHTTRYSYLSPAKIKYGIKTLKILNSGKSLWNPKRYNEATSIIASMRMDPTREEFSAPIASVRNSGGISYLKETLSRNILSMNGISIERPRPRRRRRNDKEDIETEEIVGEETLAELTNQAVETVNEDIEEEAEILEDENTRVRRKFGPLNTFFVEKLINKDSSDVFKASERKGIAPGLTGFNMQKSDNILEVLYNDKPDMENKIRNLPNQIKSLFMSDMPVTVNNWFDVGQPPPPRGLVSTIRGDRTGPETDPLLNAETYEMFRYNYFILQKVEYLTGFEISDIDGQQITKPIFDLLKPDVITRRSGKSLLCRMSTYKNTSVYVDTPKELRLPIRDTYFLITPGGERVEGPVEEELTEAAILEEEVTATDRAARRLARTTSLSRTAHRIMKILLEKEGKAENYYQYTSTIFINQPKDLIQEGAEIKSGQQPPLTPGPTPSPSPPAMMPIMRGIGGTGGTGGGQY